MPNLDDITLPSIGIVPDSDPNANVTRLEVPASTDFHGSWREVSARLEPLIPKGWHLVSMRYERDGAITARVIQPFDGVLQQIPKKHPLRGKFLEFFKGE